MKTKLHHSIGARTSVRFTSLSSNRCGLKSALLATALALFTHTTFAQTWQTVDDFQYVAGGVSLNYGLTVAPNGTLFASGYAGDSAGLYHGLVMASTDSGNTWSAPLDDYLYGADWATFYDGGMVADASGNLYVAGETYYVGSNPQGD